MSVGTIVSRDVIYLDFQVFDKARVVPKYVPPECFLIELQSAGIAASMISWTRD